MIEFLRKIRKPFSTIAGLFLFISLLPVVFAVFSEDWAGGLITSGYFLLGSSAALCIMWFLFYWDYKWFQQLEAESPVMAYLRDHGFTKQEAATRWEYSTWYEGVMNGYRIEAKVEKEKGNGFLSNYSLSLSATVSNVVEGETYRSFKDRHAEIIQTLDSQSIEMYPGYVAAQDLIRIRKQTDSGEEMARIESFVQALKLSGLPPNVEP
ncbi:MAG: hypothetical protein ICV83_30985 [Cytophagales bacterium]|nr:hypothetical protein [Cytophagales bacterium]